MPVRLDIRSFALGILLIVFGTGTAWADAIDGEWCNDKGRHFTIQGPNIVTPEGTATKGDYSRHAFSYTAPAPEPLAGTTVFMRLLNELTVHLRVGPDAAAPVEVWTRCQPVS